MNMLDPVDVIRKTFLAGVGAVATGAEKSQELVNDLVRKGELTVEQGKTLNEELTRKASSAIYDTQDALLRGKMESMTPDERAAYAKKVADMAADIDSKAKTVHVDVEDASDADGDKADEASAE
ncbi:MAG: phasin family protein [Atopobiaceae bacterium]